jgi:hypothetical protein
MMLIETRILVISVICFINGSFARKSTDYFMSYD